MTSELNIGDPAPNFQAPAVGGSYGTGQDVSLKDFRGAPLVLYFYPKDDTPGCTAQACDLRDSWKTISRPVRIFGVSIDSVASHQKFIGKYELPFPLLSDSARQMVKDYGVWVEKSMYGKRYMGTERTTFVIDSNGQIGQIFRKVKPKEHVALVSEQLKAMLG